MRKTLNEMRAELTQKATTARAHYYATKRDAKLRIVKENKGKGLSEWDIFDLVEKDSKVLEAQARLLAICDCCNIIGADIG